MGRSQVITCVIDQTSGWPATLTRWATVGEGTLGHAHRTRGGYRVLFTLDVEEYVLCVQANACSLHSLSMAIDLSKK